MEGERKKEPNKKEAGTGEVGEDGLNGLIHFQAVAFFPIIHKHFRGPPRHKEPIALLGDLQPAQGRNKMLESLMPHIFTLTTTTTDPFVTVLFGRGS